MDQSSFDHLARAIAPALPTRRALAAGLAALPLLGGALLAEDAAAKRQRQRGAQSEKQKHKKKKPYCVNGQTTHVSLNKKSKKRLKKQGATPGACAPSGCQPACSPGAICCGATCKTGPFAFQTTIGSSGTGSAGFRFPSDIAITPDTLTAFIADSSNNRVSVWTRPSVSAAWANLTAFGTGDLNKPAGISLSPDTLTIGIADTNNHRISVWHRTSASSPWTAQATLGGGGSGTTPDKFKFPYGVAISPDGLTAVIADTNNNRASVWTRPANNPAGWTNGQVFGATGSPAELLQNPLGVAVTADGLTVLVADTDTHRVAIWTRASTGAPFSYHSAFGSGPGAAPGQFNRPVRIALASDQLTAYITDWENARVTIWTRPSAASAAWTPLTAFGSAGSGPAQFSSPRGVAVSPDGQTVWVTDLDLDRVTVWAMACPA